jgi:hypothetical protein
VREPVSNTAGSHSIGNRDLRACHPERSGRNCTAPLGVRSDDAHSYAAAFHRHNDDQRAERPVHQVRHHQHVDDQIVNGVNTGEGRGIRSVWRSGGPISESQRR